MAQEFTINSTAIENKINQLLPSQGGFGAGIDFSASTMVIPIVDLTESAEGASVRQDLQTALSFNDISTFEIQNTNTNVISTTGYWRVFGANSFKGSGRVLFTLTDASATSKLFLDHNNQQSYTANIVPFDFNLFLIAGDVLNINSFSANGICRVCVKQIATLDGTLTTPS